MNPQLLPKVRSDLLMQTIRGQFPCTARVSSFFPGHRCSDVSTVVGCHLPVGPSGGKGVSTKVTDLAVLAGCFNCHQIIDGVDRERANWIEEKYASAFMHRLLCGLVETHSMLLDAGVISVAQRLSEVEEPPVWICQHCWEDEQIDPESWINRQCDICLETSEVGKIINARD